MPSASKTAAPAAKSAGPQLIEAKDYTGVILPYDYPWSRGKKRWAANGEAVAKAEQCIARELPKMKASPDYQEDKVPLIVNRLNEYRRQYLGYTDEKGRHMLWVNFFLEPHGQEDDWQTSLVLVKGGGHGFFNVTADVAGGTCGELRINSPR